MNTLIQSIRNVINGRLQDNEIIVPIEDRSISTLNSGKNNISTEVFDLLTGLRNNLVLGKAGATIITSSSDLKLPRFNKTQANWKGETELSGDNTIMFDDVLYSPYRLTSKLLISNEWLMMDSNNASQALQDDLINAICEKIEQSILGTSDGLDSPEGFFHNYDEITEASYDEIVKMENELDEKNIPNNRYFIVHPSAKSKLRKTFVEKGSGRSIFERGKVLSTNTEVTNSIVEDGILYGDFSDLVIVLFNPILITVNPFTYAIEGKTEITVNCFIDAKARRNDAFVKRIISDEPKIKLTGHLRGKFTDDSTSDNWWCKINYSKTDISQYVDPVTKEFEVDMGEVNTMRELFAYNEKIEKLYEVPVDDKVTNMQNMFNGCSSLQSIEGIENWNTTNVTDMYGVFQRCSSLQELNVSNWNVGKVTTMGWMYAMCYKLQSLNLSNWNIEKMKTLSQIFYDSSLLQSLNLSGWNTENIISIYQLFYNCNSLKTLEIGNWNVGKAELYMMFGSCISLENINGSMFNIMDNLDMSSCKNLSMETVLMLIDGLAEVEVSKTLTLYSAQYDQLTTDQIAVATSKNWSISRS